jgi:hypothetical protein
VSLGAGTGRRPVLSIAGRIRPDRYLCVIRSLAVLHNLCVHPEVTDRSLTSVRPTHIPTE